MKELHLFISKYLFVKVKLLEKYQAVMDDFSSLPFSSGGAVLRVVSGVFEDDFQSSHSVG